MICTPYRILCFDNIYIVIFAALTIIVSIVGFILSNRVR